ncbi:recombinase family protein [Radiobacillus deserti]|uniref:Recombinase family protein n=1 Tax=Radiobacillus deserti TaxID=2594883 RepID=A0A516KKS1_9BACI|nr:recombinase family protein [Radiobacillus deserti]QDP41984.1 recombinase family protein [Radiobacillus deserti]
MKNNRKVIGLYTRVSSGQKAQFGQGMEQKIGIRVAKELFGQDIDIKFYVDEGFGPKCNTERNQMLKDVKQCKLDAVITYCVSRISNTFSHALKVVKEIHYSNVRFISIIEGEYTPLKLNREFKILEVLAQLERKDHAERIKKGDCV